ncbi:MAG TPA: DUF4271 domain-containing protein [Salinimicrobium sp.]|nr:DUF4271 domain-containing protein [Salinimicrobium sp.]
MQKKLEALERNFFPPDWITLLLLLVFILLVVIKWAFPGKFHDFSRLLFHDKYLLMKGRETTIFDSFNRLLFLVSLISVSIFIFIVYRTLSNEDISRPIVIFIRIATAYGAFVLLKYFIEKIISNILSIESEMNNFLFTKLSYRNFLALLLLPVSLYFLYVQPPGLTLILIIFGLFLLLQLIIVIDILKKNQQFIIGNLFYFILYLCALEIGPYYILYKLFTKG